MSTKEASRINMTNSKFNYTYYRRFGKRKYLEVRRMSSGFGLFGLLLFGGLGLLLLDRLLGLLLGQDGGKCLRSRLLYGRGYNFGGRHYESQKRKFISQTNPENTTLL